MPDEVVLDAHLAVVDDEAGATGDGIGTRLADAFAGIALAAIGVVIANATEYGLVAYVHSRDPRRITTSRPP